MCHFVRMKGIKGKGWGDSNFQNDKISSQELVPHQIMKIKSQKLHDASHAINPAANP